jgi:stage II sporulation protein P
MMSMPKRPNFKPERESSGATTLVLIVLVVVAVLGAKYYGVIPGKTPGTPQQQVTADAARVLLYTAHPTENYAPKETHAKGIGDVANLLYTLQDELSVLGVEVLVEEPVLGIPWDQSFTTARRLVQPRLAQGNGVAAVLDLHRDALEGRADGYTTTMIGQNAVAQILFVIGDVDNPYVEQNLAFAEALRTELEALAPGICRGVKVLHDQLNGDLHPRSAQVFIGDYSDNTIAEAEAATRYLAQALVRVLKR